VKKFAKKIDQFAAKRAKFDENVVAKFKPQMSKDFRRNYI
jgi:hypothetical protein